MDFDQYVAARYGRLIEQAVLLGCAEGEAGTCVDRVLIEQRKRIRRADDPDPLVHEALERAISGAPVQSRRAGPLVAIGLVVVAVAVGAALTYRPPPRPVPSLFALDGSQAQRLLEDQGYDVLLRPARSCEPEGLVLESDPPAGTRVREGATVTVRTAVPSGVYCQALFLSRADAWDFVSFALGHDAPRVRRHGARARLRQPADDVHRAGGGRRRPLGRGLGPDRHGRAPSRAHLDRDAGARTST